jgi:hypothetical protein
VSSFRASVLALALFSLVPSATFARDAVLSPNCRAARHGVRFARVPKTLLAAVERDVGRFAAPGAPFDQFDFGVNGIRFGLMSVNREGDLWLLSFWRGMSRVGSAVFVTYRLDLSGSAVLVRSEKGDISCWNLDREVAFLQRHATR